LLKRKKLKKSKKSTKHICNSDNRKRGAMGIKKNHVYSGDAREIMTGFPSNSVQCGVTSPPYWNLRNYNVDGQLGHEATPEEYVRKVVLICRELRRVLKENGILFLNLGDGHFKSDSPESIYKLKPKDLIGIPWRVALALQYDGWFLRSDVVWYKPNASPEGSVYDRPTRAHEYVFILTKKGRYYWDQDAVRIPNESAGIRLNVDSDYVTEEIISNSVEAIEKGKVELKKRIEKTIKDTGVTRKLACYITIKKRGVVMKKAKISDLFGS